MEQLRVDVAAPLLPPMAIGVAVAEARMGYGKCTERRSQVTVAVAARLRV
jgi:hypothetical protein